MNTLLAGLTAGTVGGTGLSLVALRMPILRRPGLEERVGPYLRDTSRPSRLLERERTLMPFPTMERILRPFIGDGIRFLDRVVGGASGTRRRLAAAGRTTTLEEFRAEQVLWAAAGLLVAVGLSVIILAIAPGRSPFALLLLCASAAIAGVVIRDFWLTREVNRRGLRMMAEFPTVAELIALAVTAGEGPLGALERVSSTCGGELAKELRLALADARAGTGIVAALEGVAARTSVPMLARFIDGMVIAIERGTPLSEVLRAQATDVREAGRRALMEAGGKKEIGMMVPVVFLIMPVTVVFALFPGLVSIHLAA